MFLILFLIVSSIHHGPRMLLSRHSGPLVIAVIVTQFLELFIVKIGETHALSSFGCSFLTFLLLAMQTAVPLFFPDYFVRRHRHETTGMFVRRCLNILPYLIGTGLLLSSIWSNYIFYTDVAGFHAGKYFWILGLEYALYAAGALVLAVIHPKRRRIGILRCIGVLAADGGHYILMLLFPQSPLYCLCTTAMVFLMFSNETEASRSVDIVSGALCRETLMSEMRSIKESGLGGHLFAIALDNFKLVNETYGLEGGNLILRQLTRELQEEFDKDKVYRFGGDVFTVYVREETETAKVLDRLHQIFSRPIRAGTLTVRLTACIGVIHLKLHAADEFAFALEYAVTQAKGIGRAAVFNMAEQSTDLMKRQKAIEQAMYDNISKKQFEVHYQPIWDIRQQKFHSMEALARLNVPGYGYVSPEEFIRMAERNGTILQIGLLVLEEVCRFIRSAKPEEYGIEFIEVNLSVVQCTKDKIYNSIREVLERYNVPPSMINLEITESAAAYSEKKLIQNMARMSLMDLTFSLDDYGSGYSNINYLVSLPFNIVKIDKYLVWSAAKSVKSREILEHTISMFKAIRLRVVTEGIEDPEMARMVADMGADYIQGFYYSKPVPKDKVLEVLTDTYCSRFRQSKAV